MLALLPFLAFLAPQDTIPGSVQVRNLGVRLRDGTRPGSMTLDGSFLALSEARRDGVTRKFAYEPRRGLRQISSSTVQNFSHLQRGGLVVTTGSESLLGDLNGDGDALDLCAIVTDLASGASMPARAITPPNEVSFALGNDLVGIRIFESLDGVSLNGDFDASDLVAVGWQPSTASFLTPSFAAYRTYPLAGAWAFEVQEAGQHHDYTGDGDRSDYVYAVQDLASGAVTVLPLAVDISRGVSFVDGRVFAFSASEAGTGVDLDGDGLLTRSILHAFSLDRGELVNLQAEGGVFDHFVTGHWVVFERDEARFGDLNGDGDTLDTVVHLYDGETGTITSLGLAVQFPAYRAVYNGTLLTFLVDENQQGLDLNGDGDSTDWGVLHTLDLASGAILNTGLGGAPNPEGALILNEKVYGDQNGDGDALDQLPHFLGVGATPGLTLDLNTNQISGEGRWIHLLVSEACEGQDLNGDGDQLDLVRHLFDRQTGEVTNTGRTYDEGGTFHGHFGLWLAPENDLDLNGDGDTADQVLQVQELRSGATRNLGLALHPSDVPQMSDDLWAFPVDETRQGIDLDGNGLIEDVRVVHVIDRRHKIRRR